MKKKPDDSKKMTMNTDEKLMRGLAFKFQFRKYTNVKDYTEQELQTHMETAKFMDQLCDPERGLAVSFGARTSSEFDSHHRYSNNLCKVIYD